MQRKSIFITVLVVLAILGFYFALNLLKPTPSDIQLAAKNPEQVIASAYADAQRQQVGTELSTSAAAAQLDADKLYQLAMQNLPDSLQGTAMDGSFRLDANGRLIVEPSVVRVFEYFMSSIGEDSLETIIARVKNLIDAALPDSAKGDAHLLLAQYLDYRQQQGDLLQGSAQMGGSASELRETFNLVKQMRRDIFGGAHADSLFKGEESYMQYNLNSMELNNSQAGQSELDNIASLRALAIDLPESHKKVVEEQLLQRELDERTLLLKQDNATPEELRAMREQLIGSEAAERLGELDMQRSAWQQRVNNLQQDYQAGLAQLDDRADAAAKNALLQALLDQHASSEPERKRMQAMLSL